MKETCATDPAAFQAEVYDDIANSHDPSVTQIYISASGLCETIAKNRDVAVR